MPTTYTKSLSGDFGGNLKIGQMHEEVDEDGGIAPTLQYITHDGDDVDFVFDSALSAGEQTTLDSLISSHVPDNSPLRNTHFTLIPNNNSTKAKTYTKLARFKYDGSDLLGTINYIDVLAYKDTSPTSYDLRIYDITNSLVIAEKTGLTNTIVEIVDLGTISNVPTNEAVMEIQGKQTGGTGNNKNVYVDQVIVYHNN